MDTLIPSEGRSQLEQAQLEELFATLDSGDIVLFERQCLRMGSFYGIAVCGFAKLASRWDHVGLIYRTTGPISEGAAISTLLFRGKAKGGHVAERKEKDDGKKQHVVQSGSLFVIDANFSGVTLTPLVAKLIHTRSQCVAIRRLSNFDRASPAYRAAFEGFLEHVHDKPYMNAALAFLAAIVLPPDYRETLLAQALQE